MDGFDGTDGVVVLGATNRPEILDPALLRPGRFDRRLTISPPDRAGRRAILDVHVRDVPLADDVDLDAVAASTPGMVGAELENLIKEAAILAARRGRDRVQTSDFNDALGKIVCGTHGASCCRRRSAPDGLPRSRPRPVGHAHPRRRPGAQDFHRSTRPRPGGDLPESRRRPLRLPRWLSARRIAGALGGRAAEELVFGEITTGAESDLEQATRVARQMVGRWGMSSAVGLVSLLPGPGHQPTFGFDGDQPAPATLELLDAEVRRLLEEGAERAQRTLTEHRS